MAETAPAAFLGVENSVTGRAWRARLADAGAGLAVAQRAAVPEIVGRVLAARGVAPAEAEAYLNPTLRALLPDPSSLKDVDRACTRLAQAVMGDERVTVFGDYDVDGAASAALFKRFFASVGAPLDIYVPDRIAEGYGPNAAALLRMAESGVRVVVTVDCGTLAFAALEAAAEAGLDVIVVDHHMAEPRLPRAFAVVNPNRLDETNAYGQLAAVGVAYLVIVGLNRALRDAGWYQARREPDLLQWLDLVALATVCDVVPLTGLNRAFTTRGLAVMARRGNAGLAALADVARLGEAPRATHLGYALGPRVNAGGRVGRADLGARLLTTGDATEARELAETLDRLNAERRTIEAMVHEAALAKVEDRYGGDPPPAIVLAHPGWHPGVVGIVASRLAERYRRPAVVIGIEAGVGKGSGRSVAGVDLGAAVTAARQSGLLLNGGGHPMAAGLTVAEDKIAALEHFLGERVASTAPRPEVAPALELDGALAIAAATPDLVDLLDRAGPYGAGNPEPGFALARARVVRADVVGTAHVRCVLAGDDGGRLRAIAFGAAERPLGRALLERGTGPLHIAGHVRADSWRGARRVELHVNDAAAAVGPTP